MESPLHINSLLSTEAILKSYYNLVTKLQTLPSDGFTNYEQNNGNVKKRKNLLQLFRYDDDLGEIEKISVEKLQERWDKYMGKSGQTINELLSINDSYSTYNNIQIKDNLFDNKNITYEYRIKLRQHLTKRRKVIQQINKQTLYAKQEQQEQLNIIPLPISVQIDTQDYFYNYNYNNNSPIINNNNNNNNNNNKYKYGANEYITNITNNYNYFLVDNNLLLSDSNSNLTITTIHDDSINESNNNNNDNYNNKVIVNKEETFRNKWKKIVKEEIQSQYNKYCVAHSNHRLNCKKIAEGSSGVINKQYGGNTTMRDIIYKNRKVVRDVSSTIKKLEKEEKEAKNRAEKDIIDKQNALIELKLKQEKLMKLNKLVNNAMKYTMTLKHTQNNEVQVEEKELIIIQESINKFITHINDYQSNLNNNSNRNNDSYDRNSNDSEENYNKEINMNGKHNNTYEDMLDFSDNDDEFNNDSDDSDNENNNNNDNYNNEDNFKWYEDELIERFKLNLIENNRSLVLGEGIDKLKCIIKYINNITDNNKENEEDINRNDSKTSRTRTIDRLSNNNSNNNNNNNRSYNKDKRMNKNKWSGKWMIITGTNESNNIYNKMLKKCKEIRILPYWGTSKERTYLRKIWENEESFDLLITTYNIAIIDDKYINKIKWNNVIYDDPYQYTLHPQCNWKTLLTSIKSKNRTLLSDYTIQQLLPNEICTLFYFVLPELITCNKTLFEYYNNELNENYLIVETQCTKELIERIKKSIELYLIQYSKSEILNSINIDSSIVISGPLSKLQQYYYNSTINNKSISIDIKLNELLNICNHISLTNDLNCIYSPFSFTSFTPIDTSITSSNVTNNSLISVINLSSSVTNNYNYEYININNNVIDYIDLNVMNPIQFKLPNLIYLELYSDKYHYNNNNIDNINNSYFTIFNNNNRTLLFTCWLLKFTISEVIFISKQTDLLTYPLLINNNVKNKKPSDIYIEYQYNKYSNYIRSISECCKVIAPPIDLICNNINFNRNNELLLNNKYLFELLFGNTTVNNYEVKYWNGYQNEQPLIMSRVTNYYKQMTEPLLINYNVNFVHKITTEYQLLFSSVKIILLDNLLKELYRKNKQILLYSNNLDFLDIIENYLWYRRYNYHRVSKSKTIKSIVNREDIFIYLVTTLTIPMDSIASKKINTMILFEPENNTNKIDWLQVIDTMNLSIRPNNNLNIYRILTEDTVENNKPILIADSPKEDEKLEIRKKRGRPKKKT